MSSNVSENDSSVNSNNESQNVIVEYINSLVIAFGRFLKSSYLSVAVLVIILLLVQSLEQANTLLVDMVESNKPSLVMCFAVISFFAAVLSHYPIYIYYSKDLNNSKDKHLWYAYKLFLNYYIFTYRKIENKEYQQDFKAKFLRQAMGLVIFSIWHYYIYQAFYPKLVTTLTFNGVNTTKYVTVALALLPLFSLIALLHKLNNYQVEKKKTDTKEAYDMIENKRKAFTKGGGLVLLIMVLVVIFSAIITLILLDFNYLGYWLLQLMTFFVAILYVLFRVFRVYVISYSNKYFHISNSVGYLRFYFYVALALIALLVYFNFAVYFNTWLANAMFILLSCFFLIYYILACSLKYYFVLDLLKDQKEYLFPKDADPLVTPKGYLNNCGLFKKKSRANLIGLDAQKKFAKRRRRVSSILTVLFVVICLLSLKGEKRIHELEIYKIANEDSPAVKMDEFKRNLLNNVPADKSMLFVAAHGGGLKANIWTMKVLNKVQKESKGVFLDRTVSLSGASGGMMGLSLYSVLSGRYPGDYVAIDDKINLVAKENFASRDVAFTFGYDFVRKFVPFSYLGKYRDRSYYAMVRYRNILEDTTSMTLDDIAFNTFWKDSIYDNSKGHFPSLIINTAKTNGKRGVFYSVDYTKEGKIFSNSDKLSQLNKGYIAFYEAVSSTNRFPALSPAAKIKGYGHYIDAGAIDNSGLLSSLDLYNYFEKDTTFSKRRKVFVEILNGKSSYIGYLIQKFKKEKLKKDTTYKGHISIDEIEQDNIIADIKTGLNLDKIPNYLSDMLQSWEDIGEIEYVPIYLPFHIEVSDVEDFLGGEIECPDQHDDLQVFLDIQNDSLKIDLKDNANPWSTYEPTLARHLSKSTITYYDQVLKGEIMAKQIKSIKDIL